MNTENMINKDDDECLISRTEQKKAARKLVLLAEQLVALSDTMLLNIPLSDELRNAIGTAKKIKVGNPLKRQMHFIAKLIRKTGPEPIHTALDNLQQQDCVHEKNTKITTQWRDRLIDGNNTVISEFIEKFPNCNKQKLNQLVRAAIKEHRLLNQSLTPQQNTKQKRTLFNFLREVISK
ncbi:hypothetical protein AB835_06565 [Candidatus Endobugula sertula]|uniref:Ribosome-associated protein n=1 Tax=Candidatus Endobugula sertula TaxID=62101 RepID=A0A1D2QQL3_9GAMM|nr:hypothetical protein AB835_06565 [Candidatus Endobugula sertula]